MERKIVALSTSTNNGETAFLVGELLDNGGAELKVEAILFRRDGLANVNKGVINEAHYLVKIVNELNKEISFISVPERTVLTVTFIEIEEKKDDEVKIEKIA